MRTTFMDELAPSSNHSIERGRIKNFSYSFMQFSPISKPEKDKILRALSSMLFISSPKELFFISNKMFLDSSFVKYNYPFLDSPSIEEMSNIVREVKLLLNIKTRFIPEVKAYVEFLKDKKLVLAAMILKNYEKEGYRNFKKALLEGERVKEQVFDNMIMAIKEIHGNGISHNDYHLGNMLFTDSSFVVVDFEFHTELLDPALDMRRAFISLIDSTFPGGKKRDACLAMFKNSVDRFYPQMSHLFSFLTNTFK